MLAGLLAALACGLMACAQAQTAIPYPRIETGTHTAVINRIAVDRAERWVVTASDDKTARVWNLQTGELERILRPPIGEEGEGWLYAVAISPDGSRVAVGGFTGVRGSTDFPIYLFDRADSRLLQRSRGYADRVIHLAFSADGKRLAAAFKGGGGLRLLAATALTEEVARDDDCRADSYGVDFDPADRLVASCFDGQLRLYDAKGQRIARRQVEGGERPYGVAFSPDGTRIAVGFYDSTAVTVVSGRDLSLLYRADTGFATKGSLESVAWSRDGERLHAGGRFDRNGQSPVVSWPAQGRGAAVLHDASPDTIMALAPLSGGRLAYGGGGPTWGVLGADGRRERPLWPALLDHRDNQPGFRVARDGLRVEFSFDTWKDGKRSRAPARFDLRTRRLETAVQPDAGLAPPRTDGLPVKNWNNHTAPTFNEKRLATLEPYERSRALAVATDESGFVLGTDWSLRSFDAHGEQRWERLVPGVAWAVNYSADGRFVLAALGDGTIRWYDAASGNERLALFIHAQDQRWVLFTPEGFYQASPGGDALLGYQINRGPDREGEFVDSAQLAGVFFR
ncbi:MAG: hypothetical protein JNN21_01050, partial [Candidatus Accumulibacter sp.]|nr:hypothetical protein [Accumulibacter sp.]